LSRPVRLLIVWDSRTGAARALAQAAADGARQSTASVEIDHRYCSQADAQCLLQAHGFVFAFPEMLGTMSGPMKHFFERTYYPVLEHLQGRPYGAIVAAGSDGTGAARQLARILTGWRLKAVADPLIVCTQAQTPQAIAAPKSVSTQALARAAQLGAGLAEGLALGIW
jgi:multimeric flavodoxin WrbA